MTHLAKKIRLDDSEQVEETVEEVGGRAVEEGVGITEYMNASLPGFVGLVKHLHDDSTASDFIVREVDMEHRVAHLTDVSVPVRVVQIDTSDPNETLTQLMGEELTQRVHAYAQDTSTQPYILLELAMDKDTRKGIHTAIKKLFGKKLTSETVDGAIKVIPGGSAQVRDVRDKGDQWQEGDYTRFCLYKDNRDTIDAVSNLSRVLKHAFQWIVIWGRLSAKNMSYAGTKDKRGVTTQWVTAHRVAPERLARLTLRGIRVGNFSTVKKQLKLGDLQGNRFSLVIRNVNASSDTIGAIMTSLQERGFINYYGMQRFGSSSVPTHRIGSAVLLSNWAQVIDLLLMPRENEQEEYAMARRHWEGHHDPQEALKLFPRRCVAEIAILRALSDKPTDLVGAFSTIPYNMRTMYVHAYQSYVWNCMCSERIRRFDPLRAVVGDLVYTKNEAGADSSKSKQVRALTAEDVAYSIFDVVLPLPGFDVVYPDNEIGQAYRTLMAQDGIDPDNMKHSVKQFSLPGSYRNIVSRPGDLTWRLHGYASFDDKIAVTDADVLDGNATPPPSVPNAPLHALLMDFTLGQGEYATMFLREALKISTASNYHFALSNSMKDE